MLLVYKVYSQIGVTAGQMLRSLTLFAQEAVPASESGVAVEEAAADKLGGAEHSATLS